VRFSCDLTTVCRSVEETSEFRLSVRVLEISQGGIKLLSSRPFEVGALLSVELPGSREPDCCTVLAYVLRVVPQEDGECVVGCQFATELTAEEIEPFATKRLKPDPTDTRSWARFPWIAPVTYQVVEPGVLEEGSVQAIDISPNGIGLRMARPPEVGTLLQLGLCNSVGRPALSILASVVRVSSRGSKEWFVGCNFIRELTDEELRGLN
jgi:hypothetical protein